MNDWKRINSIQGSEIDFIIDGLSCLKAREKQALSQVIESAGDLDLPTIQALIFRNVVPRIPVREMIEQQAALLDICYAREIRWISMNDENYPPQLREIYSPPFLLYYRGELPSWNQPMFAVVGTRAPDTRGVRAAYELGYQLGRDGLSVVSGLAKGVDAAAHAGNAASRGQTIAVLGNGIDSVYPASNQSLALELLEQGGAILSEYPPGTEPYKSHFPARNRIIAGLSRAVVVIQAPERSGALITVDMALEQGRDVYVHTAGLQGKSSNGTASLAKEGAAVICSHRQLLSSLGIQGAARCEESYRTGETLSTGSELARLMEEELSGRMKYFQGSCFHV